MERIRDLQQLLDSDRSGFVVADGGHFDNAGFWPTSENIARGYRQVDGEMCLLIDDRIAVNVASLCAWVCERHPSTPLRTVPARVRTPGQLKAVAAAWVLRPDWHEPDESDVSARWGTADGSLLLTLVHEEEGAC